MVNKMHIPNGWRAVRLGEVADVVGGSTPSRAEQKFWDGGIPWVVPSELTDLSGRYLTSTKESITEKGMKSAGLKLIPSGSVLLTSRATIGVTAISAMPLVTNQGFQNLLVKNGIDTLWLYYCVSQQRMALQRRASGSTFLEVSRDSVRSIPVLLPPLSEQRAIAAVLGSIDETIERTEEVIAAKEQLRASLLHELLTHGVPGWHKEWKEVPLGTIPASWQVVRLGEIVEVNRSNWYSADESLILYLDLTAVVAPGILDKPKKIVAADAPSRARRRVHSGDILVSTVRPNLRGFARIDQAPKNLIASTGFAVLTPLPTVDRSFVYHHVMANPFAIYLDNATTGQAYPAVRPTDIATYRLPLPSLEEQRTIAAVLDGINETLARARAEWERLQSLKESVADALLTGRVQVAVTVQATALTAKPPYPRNCGSCIST